MKKLYYIFLLLLSLNTVAQTDTIVIIKTDTVFVSEKQDELYKRYVEEKRVETNHMWKLNLLDLALYNLNLGYEQKIGRMWSTEVYASYSFNSMGSVMRGGIHFNENWNSLSFADVELQFKYYYNLNQRQRKGKKTYGFSGNYLSASMWYNYFDHGNYYVDGVSIEHHTNYYSVGLKCGIQRRVADLVFLDGFVGVLYTWEEDKSYPFNPNYGEGSNTLWDKFPYWVVGIRIGFGVDSFKNMGRIFRNN